MQKSINPLEQSTSTINPLGQPTSILWDNQHQHLPIQPSNASNASLPLCLASNRARQVHKQPSRLTFLHNNKTRKWFGNGESFDSCAHHFAKQFEHETTLKQMWNITEHHIVWHGNLAEQITEHKVVWHDNHMSVVKAFRLCIAPHAQKRRLIIKKKLNNNNERVLVNGRVMLQLIWMLC